MPVLDTERATTPRSAVRYRPLATDSQTARSRRNARQFVIPDDLEQEEEEEGASIPRRSQSVVRQKTPARQPRWRFHPIFWLGLCLLILLGGWIGLTQVINWGTNELNTLRYGTTRTFQMDALLGNGDSSAHPSHILAFNLHGEIILEVFPGGDVSHVQSYILTTLTGPDSAQAVVTVQLFDPNHTGKPDLIIHVGDMESLMISDQGSFRPPTPAERQQLLSLLQQTNQ